MVLAACGSDTLGPHSVPLRLEGSIGKSTLRLGDTTSVVFRLRNVGQDTLALNFGSSCHVLPYISTPSGEVVYPDGGWWGCLAVLTSLTLAPGAERVTSVLIRAGADGTHSEVPLPPGQYQVYARLQGAFPIQSASISLRVE